jgi:hypothetical protein
VVGGQGPLIRRLGLQKKKKKRISEIVEEYHEQETHTDESQKDC